MTNTNLLTIFVVTFAVAILGVSSITPAFAAPVQNPTNWHYYEYVSDPGISWTDANNAASAQTFLGVNGHLVTITSGSEKAFVSTLLSQNNFRPWIGLTDETSEGTFQWVTGEPLVYTNWNIGEPSNANGVEHYVEFLGAPGFDGVWNDNTDFNHFITGYVIEYDVPPQTNVFTQILDELKEIWEAITGIAETVDRIETAVNDIEPGTGSTTERVTITVNLDDIKLKAGEVTVLLDTTGSGTLSTVHVAANLPCDKDGAPQIHVVAGVAGGSLSGVLTEAADNTGFDGPEKTCVFHDTVNAADLGHDITDVIIINPGTASDDDEKGKSQNLKGVVVTVTGTYN